jgi:AcrR family transcriptional regulator
VTTGRRRRPDVRREEILDATLAVVVRDGLVAARVGDVAEHLGVSTALVFYHFGTKDALVAEAFAYAVERDLSGLAGAVEGEREPVERLRRVLELYGPTGTATGTASGWRLWIDAWALAQHEAEIRNALRRLDLRWTEALRQVVDDGVARGSFTCNDPSATVARVSALLDGLSVAVLVYRTVTLEQLRRWVAEAVASELGIDAEALQ